MKETPSEIMERAKRALDNKDEAIYDALCIEAINNSDDHILSMAHRSHGIQLMKANRVREAIPFLTKSIQLYPGFIGALHSRAEAYLAIDELEMALDDFNAVLRINPTHTDALINKIQTLDSLIRHDSETRGEALVLGKLSTQQTKWIEAQISCHTTLLECDSNSALNRASRAISYYHLGLFDEAITDLKKTIKSTDAIEPFSAKLGIILFHKHQPEDAQQYLDIFIRHHEAGNEVDLTEIHSAYFYRGLIHDLSAENDRIDTIIADFIKSTEHGTHWSGRAYNRAAQLMMDTNIDQAIEYFNRAQTHRATCGEWPTYAKNIQQHAAVVDACTAILQLLKVKDPTISHYTSISVANILCSKAAKFQISSTERLNDPEEGRVLDKFLSTETQYDRPNKSPVFIGSFSSNNDALDLWRLYGKEGGTEAAGCVLTFNTSLIDQSRERQRERGDELFRFIHKVAYYNAQDQSFAINGEPNAELTNAFKNLKTELDKLPPEILASIQILQKVYHLVKSHHFLSENECRIILMERPPKDI